MHLELINNRLLNIFILNNVPTILKDVIQNIILGMTPETPFLLETINYNESTRIIANQEITAFELAKEIKKTFRSLTSKTKLIVLDISKIKITRSSIYLTVLNIAIVSKIVK
jgi:hypothetical protein